MGQDIWIRKDDEELLYIRKFNAFADYFSDLPDFTEEITEEKAYDLSDKMTKYLDGEKNALSPTGEHDYTFKYYKVLGCLHECLQYGWFENSEITIKVVP